MRRDTGASTSTSTARSAAMPMSFVNSAREKPDPNRRVRISFGAAIIVVKLRPVETFMISIITAGSRPNFVPTTSASQVATNAAPPT
jgi:hypothetical protein